MLNILLMAALFGPPIHVETIPYQDVVYAEVDLIPGGGLELFVLKSNGDTLLIEYDELRFVGGDLQAVLYLDDDSVVFTTTFVDGEGDEHEVITNCANYHGGLRACAEHHRRAVDIMKELFPKEDTDAEWEMAA